MALSVHQTAVVLLISFYGGYDIVKGIHRHMP
jgi:hypothetical protein